MFAIVMSCIEFVIHVCCGCFHPRDPIPSSSAKLDALDHASPSASGPDNLIISQSEAANRVSGNPIIRIPGQNMTVEAIDSLIAHLENCIKQLQSTSRVQENSFQVWEKYTSDIPGFLKYLEQKEEVTAERIAKDTVLPALVEFFEGIGGFLHWFGFGCTMLVWGIDKLDKQHQNFVGCREVLQGTVFLLTKARTMWVRADTKDQTSIKDDLTSIFPRIGEIAFTASAICVSCSSRDDFASMVTRFLGATTLETSISNLRERIMMLAHENMGIVLERVIQILEGKLTLKRALSAYRTPEDEDPVLGRTEQLADIESMLKAEDKQQEIVAVCLHGMGGVGKSTLALTVYNKLLTSNSKQRPNGVQFVYCRVQMELESELQHIPRFQESLLQEICLRKEKEADLTIRNERDGRERLRLEFTEVGCSPLLLYIDNVEHPEFLPELLPRLTHLPKGSRILITSRNARASTYLQELGVAEDACHSMEVKTLDEYHSRALLRRNALIRVRNEHILDDDPALKDLEDQVLSLCGGLPLALMVMGRYIAYRENGGAESVETWRSVIRAMKEGRPVDGNSNDKLYKILRVSIDALDEVLKRNYFDIVTYLLYHSYGRQKAGLEFIVGADELQNLIDRHLLEHVTEYDNFICDIVECHDVIAALVKSLVSGSGHDARIINELENVDEEELGNIVCIQSVEVTDVQLRRMKLLRYAFQITVHITTEGSAVDGINLLTLKVLTISREWPEVPLKLKRCPNLRVLHASDADRVLLEDLVAPDLHELYYQGGYGGHSLSFSPRIQHLSLLQSLSLFFPESESLPDCISKLVSLKVLCFDKCRSLRYIPEGIGELRSLSHLSLDYCESLETLPEEISMLRALRELNLNGCESLRDIPRGITKLTSLSHLVLSGCKSLQTLPKGIFMLTALGDPDNDQLDMGGCESLRSIPEDIGELTSLGILNLRNCKSLETLPNGISKLTNLWSLDLGGCSSLKSLPDGISMLVDLGELVLDGCESLRRIPEGIGNICLTSLTLSGCKCLETLPDGISMLIWLNALQLRDCESLPCIPKGIFNLTRLVSINLSGCCSLNSLPEGISELTNLSHLILSRCSSLHSLPKGISMLTALRSLYLRGCASLRCIPEGIGELRDLRRLDLSGCKNLEALPVGITMLTALEELDWRGCESLRSIPEGISEVMTIYRRNISSGIMEAITERISMQTTRAMKCRAWREKFLKVEGKERLWAAIRIVSPPDWLEEPSSPSTMYTYFLS